VHDVAGPARWSFRGTLRSFACIGLIVGAIAGCHVDDCADVGAVLRSPADTTVALHGSIVLAAGTGGSCIGGPISYAQTHWQSADSTIVSVAVIDSIHVRINGLAVGTTSVTASENGSAFSTTQVTVR
jgi:hypothetical protein